MEQYNKNDIENIFNHISSLKLNIYQVNKIRREDILTKICLPFTESLYYPSKNSVSIELNDITVFDDNTASVIINTQTNRAGWGSLLYNVEYKYRDFFTFGIPTFSEVKNEQGKVIKKQVQLQLKAK